MSSPNKRPFVATENVEPPLKELKTDAGKLAVDAKATLLDVTEVVTQSAGVAFHKAQEAATLVGAIAAEKAVEAKDKALPVLNSTMEKVKDVSASALETAQKVGQTAQEVGSSALHTAQDATVSALHTAESVVASALHTAQEAAASALHTAQDVTSSALHTASEVSAAALESVQDSYSQVKDAATNLAYPPPAPTVIIAEEVELQSTGKSKPTGLPLGPHTTLDMKESGLNIKQMEEITEKIAIPKTQDGEGI